MGWLLQLIQKECRTAQAVEIGSSKVQMWS